MPQLSGGGAERVILNILDSLHSKNYHTCLIVLKLEGPLVDLIPKGLEVHSLQASSLKGAIAPLIGKLRAINPKVIISTFGYINVVLLAIRFMLPKKTNIWIREANLPSISLYNNPYPKLMMFLYRLLYKKADKVICTSKRMQYELISDFLVPKTITDILPNSVDIKKIHNSQLPIKRFDNGGVCYVASGRLTFQKGFDHLLHWFSELKDRQSTLTILGDGILKDSLIREAELLDIQSRVKFVGFCDNPWKWYKGADVFLLSSRWEGMSNSVLEALACNTPVIATEVAGGIKEVAEECKQNSIIIASDAQQFIGAMNKVKIKDKNFMLNSLLPERYKKENVVFTIENWLSDIK